MFLVAATFIPFSVLLKTGGRQVISPKELRDRVSAEVKRMMENC